MAQCSQCRADTPDDGAACIHCGGALALDELLGQEVLGRYRIVALLAEGGMGRVYRAEQSVGTVVRRVAIKVLRRQLGPDRQLIARFSREAETLVRLTHPNTVQLFDFGALPDGTLALVMEYVEGHSLAHELASGPLSAMRAERVLAQVCGALSEAHAHGIVHRDLKPENLLIADRVGHGDFIKVLDFGIAKVSADEPALSTKLTQQGMMIGTPPYMSPEQFSGDAVDARSDVYSLGVIAFELLTGKLPFAAKTPWEWASRHLTAPPEELPLDAAKGLLPRHAFAIRRALAKRADDRPPSVADFLDLFIGGGTPSAVAVQRRDAGWSDPAQPSQATEPVATVSDALRSPTTAKLRTRRELWVGVAAVAALLVGALALGRGSLPSSAPRPTLPPAFAPPPSPAPVPPLVIGAGLPPEPPIADPVPRETKARSVPSTSARAHRRAPSDTAEHAGDLPVGEPQPTAYARVVGRTLPASTVPEATALRAPRSVAAAGRAAPIAPDLTQRIGQIRAALGTRLETAVGLFQAAIGKHGAAPALLAMRPEIAGAGEKRVRELLSAGRCAQAQALYRALRSISASPHGSALFGGGCPTP
jgi:serine/threonine protein kinase